MELQQLKWKMVERPLIPIQNSWVDAAPFAALLLLFGISIFIILKFKKRQVLRHLVQLTSLLLFAFTFHRCFCTERGLIFGISEIGKDNINVFQNMCIFIPILAFIFIFGRIFCGWICPLGFIQEGLRKFNAVKRKILLLSIFLPIIIFMIYRLRPVNFFIVQNMASLLGFLLLIICIFAILNPKGEPRLKKIKYASLFVWIIFIILGVFVTSPWCIIYGNEIDYSSIIGFIAVLFGGIVVSMAWCRYVCPLGGLLALLSRFYQYIIKGTGKPSNSYKDTCPMGAINDEGQVDRENCIYCLRCIEKYGFKIDETTKPISNAGLDIIKNN